MLSKDEEKVLRQVWDGCSEQLDRVHSNFWGDYIVPVLLRLILKERRKNKRLRNMFKNGLHRRIKNNNKLFKK